MNKMYNITMKKLRKQNKKFATIATKPVKVKKEVKEVEDKATEGKATIYIDISVYYVIFWFIIVCLFIATLIKPLQDWRILSYTLNWKSWKGILIQFLIGVICYMLV